MNETSPRTASTPTRTTVIADDDWVVYSPDEIPAPTVRRSDAAFGPTAVPRQAPATQPPASAPGRDVNRVAPSAPAANGALYTLEAPVRCPECNSDIQTLRVLRLLRTQASFTSTLPRKGYVMVCPECDRMVSAELSGLA